MKCTNKNCKQGDNLKDEDFYAQSDRSKKRSQCKHCLREQSVNRLRRIIQERKMYEIA